jgi:hypothetical protein
MVLRQRLRGRDLALTPLGNGALLAALPLQSCMPNPHDGIPEISLTSI